MNWSKIPKEINSFLLTDINLTFTMTDDEEPDQGFFGVLNGVSGDDGDGDDDFKQGEGASV